MLSLKSKQPTLAELEQALADRRVELDQALAAHRQARIDVGIASGELAEAETPENLQAHRAAMAASQATAQAKADATKALADAELALDLARTGPARAETAKVIHKGADRVERALAPLLAPLTELVRALDDVTWPEVYLYDSSHQQLHGQMLEALLALQGKGGQQFVAALRSYADGIVYGQHGYNLSRTTASEQIAVGIRKTA